MTQEISGSAAEIQWLIEDRKRRAEDLSAQITEAPDGDKKTALKGLLAVLRNEIAELEQQLDTLDEEPRDTETQIKDLDAKIADIDSMLSMETDHIVRNNLEVSKRFLQMERNHLLIEKTRTEKVRSPEEEEIERLKTVCDARQAEIASLEKRLAALEKEKEHYRILAENPDRLVSCDTTRVTVEAGTLSKLRNEAKLKAVESENLKTENRALRNEMEMLRKNVRELTLHCRDSDSQVLVLQKRLADLRKQLNGE